MKRQGLTLRESLLHLRACRPIAYPNIGFVVQLKAYEAKIFGKTSEVPFKLWQLFGIPDPTLSAKKDDADEKLSEEDKQKLSATMSDMDKLANQDQANMSEEQKAELKSLQDGQQILAQVKDKNEADKDDKDEDSNTADAGGTGGSC